MSDVYITYRYHDKVAETKEVHPDVRLDYGPDGELLGIEVNDAESLSVDGVPVESEPDE